MQTRQTLSLQIRLLPKRARNSITSPSFPGQPSLEKPGPGLWDSEEGTRSETEPLYHNPPASYGRPSYTQAFEQKPLVSEGITAVAETGP